MIYSFYLMNLKQALNHGLIMKKVHRAIKFNQKACFKPHMKKKLRKIAKYGFEKDFLKSINNVDSGKAMENVRKRGDIKIVTT